jgi:hypothetical protein
VETYRTQLEVKNWIVGLTWYYDEHVKYCKKLGTGYTALVLIISIFFMFFMRLFPGCCVQHK